MGESPFKTLRKMAGMSQRQLISHSGLSTSAIIYTEAGLYEQIPFQAHVTLTEALEFSGIDAAKWLQSRYGVQKLQDAMRMWQTAKRRESGERERLSVLRQLPLEYLIDVWPNPDRFVKDLCIPPSALHQYRTGWVKQVPEIIATALSEAGYAHRPLTMDEWKQKPSSPPTAA